MNVQLEKIDRYSFPSGLLDFAISDSGLQLFAACMDGIYELGLVQPESKKKKPRRLGQHRSFVSSIAWIESSRTLITASYDGSLHYRDLPADILAADILAADSGESELAALELTERQSVQLHSFWSWDMALSPDHRYIASVTGQYLAGAEDYSPAVSQEPTIKIVERESGKIIQSFDMLPSVQCVAFDPSSRLVAAGNLMGDLAVWEVETGKQLAAWRTKSFTSWGIIKSHCYIGGIFAVSFAPDGKSLYAAGMGDMKDPMAGNGRQLWQRFDWSKTPAELIHETTPTEAGEGLMETLAWHPSGEYFVMGGRLRGGKWNLGIFERESGKLIGEAKTGMRITTARFSSDGQTLYLGGMQGQPEPKEKGFQDFGYLERYRITQSAS